MRKERLILATTKCVRGETYHHVAGTVAVHLICNVYRPASVFSNGKLLFPLWLQVPDGVVVLGMLEQFINRHRSRGPHDERFLSGLYC
jgi:hypothetical protein